MCPYPQERLNDTIYCGASSTQVQHAKVNESIVVLNAIVCIMSGHIIISVADNVKNHECVYLSVISSLATSHKCFS